MEIATIEELKNRVLNGGEISFEEAIALSETQDIEALFDAAGEITRHFGKPAFNPCSIIPAHNIPAFKPAQTFMEEVARSYKCI